MLAKSVFLLLALADDFLLLLARGILGCPSAILLLALFVFAPGVGLVTFGSKALHGIDPVLVIDLRLLFRFLAGFNLGLEGKSLLVSLPPRFH